MAQCVIDPQSSLVLLLARRVNSAAGERGLRRSAMRNYSAPVVTACSIDPPTRPNVNRLRCCGSARASLLTFHRACPRGLLFVGATWLRLNAPAARATSVASLITSSKLRLVLCAFLGRISAQIRSPSSSIAALAALAAPAHRAAIESRIAPRSARPAPSNLRTSAAMGSSSATSRATPSALCRRHSNLSVSSSTCIRTSASLRSPSAT